MSGITVSQLNLIVAEAIRKDPRIHSVTVRGEVSGFKHHVASGHWYFSLKDDNSAINCVMFRMNTLRASLRPKDGQQVLVNGYVDVYPKNGSYQLYVTGMRDAGIGDLYVRFEELKRKLFAEGLFDPARKRTLPMLPRKVAVLTSRSGAALHDILNVSVARCPFVPIVLVPVGVQGEKAAAEIARGVRIANEETDADVLIIARGGGSAEDLWCFNDEQVARAVAASRIPVVSGVGHEIDTTICDLAADVRASTPSNAAEIVFPDRKELLGRTGALRLSLMQAERGILGKQQESLQTARLRLSALSPEKRIHDLMARSQLSGEMLYNSVRKRIEAQTAELKINRNTLNHAAGAVLERNRLKTEKLKERLSAMSPLGVLKRGYTLVYSREGRVLTGVNQARRERDVMLRFADGTADASIR